MALFLLKRLFQALFVIAGVTCVTFLVLRLVPGDPARLLVPQGTDPRTLELLREQLGTNKPIWQQFGDFLGGALQGDLGESYRFHRPVTSLVGDAFLPTMGLVATALVTAVLVSVPLGVAAAARPGGLLDRFVLVIAIAGQAMPSFWIGIMLVLFLAVQNGIFPAIGMSGPESFVLPTIALAAGLVAVLVRTTRQGMLEALSENYVRTARAKGMPEWRVVLVHALKNASLPLVTVIGLQVGFVLGNAFVIEAIFQWPGLGGLALQAVQTRDFPVLQGIVIVVAGVFVVTNLLVDVAYATLNPRIRIAGQG